MKQDIDENGCLPRDYCQTGKMTWSSMVKAQGFATLRNKGRNRKNKKTLDNGTMRAYRCEFCGLFHVSIRFSGKKGNAGFNKSYTRRRRYSIAPGVDGRGKSKEELLALAAKMRGVK